MQFTNLVQRLEGMEASGGKLELARQAAEIFTASESGEIAQIIYFMQGTQRPAHEGLELYLSEKSLIKAFADPAKAASDFKKFGDLGLAAKAAFPPQNYTATVNEVADKILALATVEGSGSQEAKATAVREILSKAGGLNAKWIMRNLVGKMRLGGSEGTIIRGIAGAFGNNDAKDKKITERAYNSCSDLGKTAETAITGGMAGLANMKIVPFSPILPMLAGRARSVDEAVKKTSGIMHVEAKLDGERVQIHAQDNTVKIFSRSGEIITPHYPDVAAHLEKFDHDFIAEGEAIAMDGETMLPFQELMHRKRKHGIEAAVKKYPVTINMFDLLYLDGVSLMDEPYTARKEQLLGTFEQDDMLRHIDVQQIVDASELKDVLDEALVNGAEGLMIKDGDGRYVAGARANAWLKLKREYMEGEAETFDLAIIGAIRGQGRRVDSYGALILAARHAGKFAVVGKVGSGFKDADLVEFKQMLGDHELSKCAQNVESSLDADVWFEPENIIEVSAFEITRSPTYQGGYGLRFPVYVRRRPDRDSTNASAILDIEEAYKAQVKQT